AEKILALAQKYEKEPPRQPYYAFGEVLCSKYTYVGWSTHGHSGGDVPLHAYGPGRPSGVVDGPGIGKSCADAMGLSLEKLNQRLFADAAEAFSGGQVTVDKSDPENPVLRITYMGKRAEMPVNKNILRIGETQETLEGVAVYAPKTGRAYIPMDAVHMIKGIRGHLPDINN
ncbi:MAG: hypothetical protein ABII06_14530, partial [Pseudomonadota bacterium]